MAGTRPVDDPGIKGMRLDKWLWAARFFKTRSLATTAVSGGKVHVNGQRVKPGKTIQRDEEIRIRKGDMEWQITVSGLGKQRRPATEAALMYTESEASRQQRFEVTAQHRAAAAINPRHQRKPDKRERRKIHGFRDHLLNTDDKQSHD